MNVKNANRPSVTSAFLAFAIVTSSYGGLVHFGEPARGCVIDEGAAGALAYNPMAHIPAMLESIFTLSFDTCLPGWKRPAP